MSPYLSRRLMLAGGLGLAASALAGCSPEVSRVIDLGKRFYDIQKRHGGRIGMSARIGTDAGIATSNSSIEIQSDERFAMCSTFKWLLAARVLKEVDDGKLGLNTVLSFTQADMVGHSPVVEAALVKGRLSVGELCAGTVGTSDNAAANLLIAKLGGLAVLTDFVRGLGDEVTRFDRIEPEMNSNIEGDERDTTTPAAMSRLLQKVFTTDVLKAQSLEALKGWMVAATTGKDRIRAGVPADWLVGDKTGTGANGAANDVAVLWPPNKPPIYLAIYTSGGALDDDGRNQVIADVARFVVDTLAFAEEVDEAGSSAVASA